MKQPAQRMRRNFRLDRACIKTRNLEQRFQQILDRIQRRAGLLHQRSGTVRQAQPVHRRNEQACRVQWLQKIMAGGCKEAGL